MDLHRSYFGVQNKLLRRRKVSCSLRTRVVSGAGSALLGTEKRVTRQLSLEGNSHRTAVHLSKADFSERIAADRFLAGLRRTTKRSLWCQRLPVFIAVNYLRDLFPIKSQQIALIGDLP